MKISEIITDKYKLRIPPTVYYELLADVREVEEVQEPTTKNDLEIVIDAMEFRTNSLIESIKSEILHFANAHCSGDDINIYDVFKVIDDCCEAENPTTKNDLSSGLEKNSKKLEKDFDELDCISRQSVAEYIDYIQNHGMGKKKSFDFIKKFVANLPPVTPQEPQSFKWCTDCKEYDQEKHCCHRWSKVIRDTVAEIGQEPKPMVEIDLYSVIKQKYIEREVLDKIRAEIIENSIEDYKYHGCGTDELIIEASEVLQIIDKYKGESEDNGNVD